MSAAVKVTNGMKPCTKCGEVKLLEAFPIYRKATSGRNSWCKECCNQRRRELHKVNYTPEYYAKNKDKLRNASLLRTVGITLITYNEMMVTQNECCYICGQHKSKNKYSLHADHDHVSGTIRKLLCANCNVGLGSFKDSPELLRLAARYLEEHQENAA